MSNDSPAQKTAAATQQIQIQKERLRLYHNLLGEDKNKTCDKTGLQLEQSLNYSLHTFLHLSDIIRGISSLNKEITC